MAKNKRYVKVGDLIQARDTFRIYRVVEVKPICNKKIPDLVAVYIHNEHSIWFNSKPKLWRLVK